MSESTKEKILNIALKLFSEKNFKAVSIREIASSCGVNVAAINYHFSNKENLYFQTIIDSILRMENDIKEIYDSLDDKNTALMAEKVFWHFIDNSEHLKNSFKLIISGTDLHQKISEAYPKFSGPPGGEYFGLCIQEELGSISEDDLSWAVRVIFSQIIHKAIVMSNNSMCENLSEVGISKELINEDTKRLVNIVLKDLRKE